MFVASYSNQMYAILRIVAGGLLACHGGQKLFGLFGGFGGNPGATAPVPSLLALAGFIEFFGGLLIALGLLTSYAAFIASGQMAVACFMVHASAGYVPIQNGGELAVLYCFLFLFIAARGRDAGKLSMNRKIWHCLDNHWPFVSNHLLRIRIRVCATAWLAVEPQ